MERLYHHPKIWIFINHGESWLPGSHLATVKRWRSQDRYRSEGWMNKQVRCPEASFPPEFFFVAISFIFHLNVFHLQHHRVIQSTSQTSRSIHCQTSSITIGELSSHNNPELSKHRNQQQLSNISNASSHTLPPHPPMRAVRLCKPHPYKCTHLPTPRAHHLCQTPQWSLS
jgi:hypothetical protein